MPWADSQTTRLARQTILWLKTFINPQMEINRLLWKKLKEDFFPVILDESIKVQNGLELSRKKSNLWKSAIFPIIFFFRHVYFHIDSVKKSELSFMMRPFKMFSRTCF